MTPEQIHTKALEAAELALSETIVRTGDWHKTTVACCNAYLSTLREHGWKPTPREETREMWLASCRVARVIEYDAAWRAMHDAAPALTDDA